MQDGLSSIQKPLAILFSSIVPHVIYQVIIIVIFIIFIIYPEKPRGRVLEQISTLHSSSLLLFQLTTIHIHPPTPHQDTTNAMVKAVPPAAAAAVAPALALPTPIPDNAAAAALPPLLPNNTSAPRVDVSILDDNNSGNNGINATTAPTANAAPPINATAGSDDEQDNNVAGDGRVKCACNID